MMNENGPFDLLLLPSILTFSVVLIGLVVFFVSKRFVSSATEGKLRKTKNVKDVLDCCQQYEQSESVASSRNNNKKKKADEKRFRGEKSFATDKWLKATLKKGDKVQLQHLNMDYSNSDSKKGSMPSCSDDESTTSSSSKTSISIDGDSTVSSEYLAEEEAEEAMKDKKRPVTKPSLTRRQRKNRKRDESGSPAAKTKPKSKKVPEKNFKHEPSPFYEKLGISDVDITTFLHSYILSSEQMLALGYPMDSSQDPGRVIIFKGVESYRMRKKTYFDVNAKEFYPRSYRKDDTKENDSGNSSESGLDEKDEICEFVYNSILERTEMMAKCYKVKNKRNCTRCGTDFYLNTEDSNYITRDTCTYHWGKLINVENLLKYQCCGGLENAQGCTQGKLHVWSGINPGVNGPFDNYVKTRPRKSPPVGGNTGAYAIDCEMCFTVKGMEVVKVTVIGVDGRLVYDTFVKPEKDIVDYNSRFSGITAKDLKDKKKPKTLREVQNDLMGFIFSDTILIGHGLENDLRVLKILHPTVVDTAVAFPHRNGLPFRRSLKQLASCFLKREIQASSEGHDSFEDARACIDLMLMRIGRDFRFILQHSYQM